MMYQEPQPIEIFVAYAFQNPRITSVIGTWRVEPTWLQRIAISHFKEMGIFLAHYNHREILFDSIIFQLKSSDEVKNMVKKAETEENERRRTRHADV